MREEIMLRRIAEKSGLPEDPDTTKCYTWTGSKTKGGFALKRVQNEYYPVDLQPYPRIKFQGKTRYVHHITFERHHGYLPDKLQNICGNTLCVNPYHWAPKQEPQTASPPPPPEFVYTEEWTPEEVLEVLEIYWETNPRNQSINWDHPVLQDVPPSARGSHDDTHNPREMGGAP